MKKNIYHKDGCLFVLGCVLLIPAVISFLIVGFINNLDYKISDPSENGEGTQYICSNQTIEEVKEEYPGKKVTELKHAFPIKSTVFLSICLGLIVYSRLVKTKEKKIIKLWDLLEKNRTLSLQILRERFGYDKKFVFEALHYINQQPNASFTYQLDDDLIYNDNATVQWHLTANCSKCGGVVNEKSFISMHTEFFACPYCAAPIKDEKFEDFKKKKIKDQSRKNKHYSGGLATIFDDQAGKGLKSMAKSAQDPDKAGVSWRPLKGGGTNITTRKLKLLNSNKAVFKPTIGSICFSSVFALIGLSILVPSINDFSFGGIFVGGIFAGIGFVMLWFSIRPIVFDTSSGFFWKGWKSPRNAILQKAMKGCTALDDILALQLISERCSGSSSNGGSRSYYSYELNLVLKDRSRINVFDHGGHKRATKDAELLAKFLDVPLWKR